MVPKAALRPWQLQALNQHHRAPSHTIRPQAWRRERRKSHIEFDEKKLEICAAEFTTSTVGDAPALPERLDQIPL